MSSDDSSASRSPSPVRTSDKQKARRCAEGLDGAEKTPAAKLADAQPDDLPRTPETASEAVAAILKSLPQEWPARARELLEKRFGSTKFFPRFTPNFHVHDTATKESALFVYLTDEVCRIPAGRKGINVFASGAVVTVGGIEFAICGFILCQATDAGKLHLFKDLTKQGNAEDWIAVLFHLGIGGGVTTEVRPPMPAQHPRSRSQRLLLLLPCVAGSLAPDKGP